MVKKFLKRVRPYSTEICIFFVFMLLSVAAIYPLVFKMLASLYCGDIKVGHFSNDAKGVIYSFWWFKYALNNRIPWEVYSLIAHPLGVNLASAPLQPGSQYPAIILTLLAGETFSHNLLILLSFLLSAVTMYFLAYYLTQNKLAGMTSGIIYAFCSYHIFQSYCHLGLAMIQWMPLYLLFLFKFNEKRTCFSVLGCAFCFALVTLTSYYYGYFMLVVTVVFIISRVVYGYLSEGKSGLSYKPMKLIALGTLVSLVLILPFGLNVFLLSSPKLVSETGALARQRIEFFSIRWWSYLLPSFENPFFGRYVKNFLYSQMSGNPAEQILFLGYVPLALAVLGIRRLADCGKGSSVAAIRWENFVILFFLLLAAVAMILSGPPYLALGSLEVPMPSTFLYVVLPMFRQYGRFGILTILSVSLLAGIGLKYLLRGGSLWKRFLVIFLLIMLILVEFSNVPPFRTIDVSAIPKVYRWLSSQPGDFIVAEYPFLNVSDPRQYDHIFYQRIHEKKLVNTIFTPESSFAEAISCLSNIADPDVPPVLSYLGVKYVIVHTDLYRSNEGSVPRIPSGQALQYGTAGQGLVFVKSFPGALVYEVEAKPQKILWLRYKNFYPSETWEDGREWNWASSNEAEVLAVNYTGRELPCDIRFFAASLGKSRNLKILLNGEEVKKITVAPAPEVTGVVLKDVRLQSGENSIMLYADLPAEKIDTYLHDGDIREATFAVAGFGIGD